MEGYVKLPRSIINRRIFSDELAYKLFIHVLLCAYRDGKYETGLDDLAMSLDWPVAVVINTIKRMQRYPELSCFIAGGRAHFTVPNWEIYYVESETEQHEG